MNNSTLQPTKWYIHCLSFPFWSFFVCVFWSVCMCCSSLTVMLSNSLAMCLMMSLCCKGCVWSNFLMTTTHSATTVSEKNTNQRTLKAVEFNSFSSKCLSSGMSDTVHLEANQWASLKGAQTTSTGSFKFRGAAALLSSSSQQPCGGEPSFHC